MNNIAENTYINDNSIKLKPFITKNAKRAFIYAQEVGYMEIVRPYEGYLNGTGAYLLLYTVEGAGTVEYQDEEHTINTDHFLLIKCDKKYKFHMKNSDSWTLLYLYFDGIPALTYYQLLTEDNRHLFVAENSKSLMSLLWQIIDLHKKTHQHAEIQTTLNITKILTEIYLFRTENSMNTEYPDFVNRLFFHLSHHYMEKLSLDILSAKYSINKYYMAKEFKRCSGVTINEYIISIRIKKAKNFLRYSNMSVGEIATTVGFSNASFFIKVFKEREHITPLMYRKQWI